MRRVPEPELAGVLSRGGAANFAVVADTIKDMRAMGRQSQTPCQHAVSAASSSFACRPKFTGFSLLRRPKQASA